jgi:hypothetical protein
MCYQIRADSHAHRAAGRGGGHVRCVSAGPRTLPLVRPLWTMSTPRFVAGCAVCCERFRATMVGRVQIATSGEGCASATHACSPIPVCHFCIQCLALAAQRSVCSSVSSRQATCEQFCSHPSDADDNMTARRPQLLRTSSSYHL